MNYFHLKASVFIILAMQFTDTNPLLSSEVDSDVKVEKSIFSHYSQRLKVIEEESLSDFRHFEVIYEKLKPYSTYFNLRVAVDKEEKAADISIGHTFPIFTTGVIAPFVGLSYVDLGYDSEEDDYDVTAFPIIGFKYERLLASNIRTGFYFKKGLSRQGSLEEVGIPFIIPITMDNRVELELQPYFSTIKIREEYQDSAGLKTSIMYRF
ncbi:hypothetical protein [Rhabdochlamydiaceae symbiont of Dictyostelium giganteum]|uniref:hypothetical protein n=1 Tax=Rhabdochlamydiaceae symbiont of Dictyostelium giganteum TaxID=3342349 RepID=UPI00384E478C